MKKMIAAVIDRILEFDTQDEVARCIDGLRAKNLISGFCTMLKSAASFRSGFRNSTIKAL